MSRLSQWAIRYQQFKDLKRREGIFRAAVSAGKQIFSDPRRVLFAQTTGYQTAERIDMNDRWELMQEYIDGDARNALDIGCNQGEIARRAAGSGLFTIGIDKRALLIDNARRLTDDEPCHFIHDEVSPETAEKLPSFDVTFLLTVYYHWGKAYGWNTAESMLRTVAENTETLFYQTPQSEEYIRSSIIRQYSDLPLVEMHREYLNEVISENTVEYIGTTDYVGGDRKDAMYVIE